MKRILFLILFVFISNSIVIAQTDTTLIIPEPWVYVSTSTANEKWYIRNKPESKSYGKIKIWIKIKMPSVVVEKKTYKNVYKLQLMNFDCANNKVAFMSEATYLTSTGELIDNYEPPYEKYMTVFPETILEAVFTKVCTSSK